MVFIDGQRIIGNACHSNVNSATKTVADIYSAIFRGKVAQRSWLLSLCALLARYLSAVCFKNLFCIVEAKPNMGNSLTSP